MPREVGIPLARVAFAVTILGLLVGLSIYAGIYDSVPRMLRKWIGRGLIPVV